MFWGGLVTYFPNFDVFYCLQCALLDFCLFFFRRMFGFPRRNMNFIEKMFRASAVYGALFLVPLGFVACSNSCDIADDAETAQEEKSSDSGVVFFAGDVGVKSCSSSAESSSREEESSSSVAPVSIASMERYVFDGIDDSEYDAEKNSLTDLRDNRSYKTVNIGNQVWMAENLSYAYLEIDSRMEPSSFCLAYNKEHCEEYGRLYFWSAAMDSAAVFGDTGGKCGGEGECKPSEVVRGVCPKGWHLPSLGEWTALIDSVGGMTIAGRALKATNGWTCAVGSEKDDCNGTDEFGFSAGSVGNYDIVYAFRYKGEMNGFWSSTPYAKYLEFRAENDSVSIVQDDRNAYSVRCLKD